MKMLSESPGLVQTILLVEMWSVLVYRSLSLFGMFCSFSWLWFGNLNGSLLRGTLRNSYLILIYLDPYEGLTNKNISK